MKHIFITCTIFVANLTFVGCGDQKHNGVGPQTATSADSSPLAIQEKFESVTVKLNAPAFGGVDGINEVTSPKVGSIVTIKSEKVIIAGNYVDAVRGEAAAGVVALIDGKPYFAVYGGERPDIAKVHNNPKYLKSQFYVEVPTAIIGLGLHDLKMRVIASDKSGYYESNVLAKLDIK